MNINDKLARFAETTKMSAIARRVGVNHSTISKYVSGQSHPRYDVALRLARALNVSPEWLIDDAQEWPPVWMNRDNGGDGAAA